MFIRLILTVFRSVCTSMDSSCYGILEAIGLTPQCDAAIDWVSGLPLYDANSTPMSQVTSAGQAMCNDLGYLQGMQLVASPAEPYIGKVCSGIIKEYYVPPSSSINETLAPLLPPFVAQYIMEEYLTGLEEKIPTYFPSSCQLAQRELMCSMIFLQPYPNMVLEQYFGPIYLPSFPNESLCLKYHEECPLLVSAVPAMDFNCSATLGPGSSVRLFPARTQTISEINLGFIVPLASPPFTPANVTASFAAECPYGYGLTPREVPEHGNIPIEGTACSVACPLAMYTSDEYDTLFYQTAVSVWICLVFAFLQVVNLSVLKPQKQNIFLVCSIVSAFVYNVIQAISLLLIKSREKSVCQNDTTTFSLHNSYDNAEDSLGYYLCAMNSITKLYLNFFYCWILFALSSEIWCRVYWGAKKVDVQRRYYMYGSGVVFLFLALFNTFYDNPDINAISPNLFCYWTAEHHSTYWLYYDLPGIISFCISLVMIIHSIYVCIKTSLSITDADRKPFLKIWKSYSMLILFLCMELLVSPIAKFYFGVYLDGVKYHSMLQGTVEWSQCIFEYFINANDHHYLDVCGITPPNRVPVLDQLLAFSFSTYVNVILLWIITLNKEAKAFWWNVFVFSLTALGVKEGLSTWSFARPAAKYLSAAKESNIFNKNFRRQHRRNSFSKAAGSTTTALNESIVSTESGSSGVGGGDRTESNGLLSTVTNLMRKSSITRGLKIFIPPSKLSLVHVVTVPAQHLDLEERKPADIELDQPLPSEDLMKPKPFTSPLDAHQEDESASVSDSDDDEDKAEGERDLPRRRSHDESRSVSLRDRILAVFRSSSNDAERTRSQPVVDAIVEEAKDVHEIEMPELAVFHPQREENSIPERLHHQPTNYHQHPNDLSIYTVTSVEENSAPPRCPLDV